MFQSKKFWAIALLAFALTGTAYAEAEAGKTENSVTGFFRRLFNYPVKAVQETGEMTGNTLNNTGDKVLSQTGEHLSKGEVGEGLVQPIQGTLETTGQTVSETVQVPVKAAEETPAS